MPNCNVALVLAAGASMRMGTCKAALPWLDGFSLLTYQVTQWLAAEVSPVVVLGAHNADLQAALPESSRAVVNPNPAMGKTSSILTGLQAVGVDWQVLAISAVDQPRPAWIYQTLLKNYHDQSLPIAVPTYQNRRGHPLLFANQMLPHLQALREETLGLRQIITQFAGAIHAVEIDSPLVLADLNTPELYQSCFQLSTESRICGDLLR